MRNELQLPGETRPVWLPPVVSVATLFVLFVTAMIVRRSGLGEAGRVVMVTLSTIAAVAIALYGVKMTISARARGWGSAVAGIVMVVLGVYTALHVLR